MSYSRGMDIPSTLAFSEADQRYINRAAAHAAAESVLRPEQRFKRGVTDLAVARVFLAVERGALVYVGTNGQWRISRRDEDMREPAMALTGVGSILSTVVGEMVRTGLAVSYRSRQLTLIPADTHLRAPGDSRASLCRFTGEDMGPMRSRLVDDVNITDCPHCQRIHAYRAPLT